MNRWFPFETERLLLREIRAEDETDVHEYASDPEVARLMIWVPIRGKPLGIFSREPSQLRRSGRAPAWVLRSN